MAFGTSNSISNWAHSGLNRSIRSIEVAGLQLSTGQKFVAGADENDTLLGLGIELKAKGLIYNAIKDGMDTSEKFYTQAQGIVDNTAGMFIRMQELAAEVLNTELATAEKTALNTEYTAILSEIQTLATTSFNGNQLFGTDSATGSKTIQVGLGVTDKAEQKNIISFASKLFKLYMENDAEMIEINPLVRTGSGEFLALDGKMGFDNSALGRQPEILAMRDLTEEDADEVEAAKYGLSYVALDGEIGCMVNGAGLAMGTMDTINYMGGTPANFLDVGGSANAETVAKGFEIILKNPNVKAIFVNIFGGIVRCDRIANGIIEATKITDVNVPVIVRLDGTNAPEAAEILKNASISNLIVGSDLGDGAAKAVAAAKQA